MSQYVCRYPDGAAGFALLLLRVCLAFVAFGVANALSATSTNAHPFHVAAGLVASLLVIGFATRWISLLLGLAILFALAIASPAHALLLASHVGGCAAVVLIGAGAFSVDARRHGRRVIQFQTTPPDRGVDD